VYAPELLFKGHHGDEGIQDIIAELIN